jgi:hypothetical protein
MGDDFDKPADLRQLLEQILLIPELIDQNNRRKDKGDPIGQVYGNIVAEDAVNEP